MDLDLDLFMVYVLDILERIVFYLEKSEIWKVMKRKGCYGLYV